jgi:membrane protein YdbS with pleckstrin-like domain
VSTNAAPETLPGAPFVRVMKQTYSRARIIQLSVARGANLCPKTPDLAFCVKETYGYGMSENIIPPLDSQNQPMQGAPPPDHLIYSGPVSMWMGIKTFIAAGLAEIAGLSLAIYGFSHREGSLGSIGLVIGVALFLASNIMLMYTLLNIKSQRYKISRRLIEREFGILVKRVDSLDLGRVRDVELSQSLFQRVIGVGTIDVFSSDKTDPLMRIECLPNPRPVYEQLRDAMIEISQRRGIVPMG